MTVKSPLTVRLLLALVVPTVVLPPRAEVPVTVKLPSRAEVPVVVKLPLTVRVLLTSTVPTVVLLLNATLEANETLLVPSGSSCLTVPLKSTSSNVLVPLTVRSPVTATVLSSPVVDTSRTLLPVPACTLISSLKVTSSVNVVIPVTVVNVPPLRTVTTSPLYERPITVTEVLLKR